MKYSKLKFDNKKFFIYGLAKSGLATFEFLKKTKSEIICWDDNQLVRKSIKKKYLLNQKKKLNKQFQKIQQRFCLFILEVCLVT